MDRVRIGVIGLGNMGSGHSRNIAKEGLVNKDLELAAVCDIDADKMKAFSKELNVPGFKDYRKMLASGKVNAILIAVPHYWHAPIAIEAARAGIHVLCEKPISVMVGPARAMVAECAKHKVTLAMMLQHRTRTIMIKMKEMAESGALGEIFRVSMVCSTWYRSQYYYDSGAWRGTWDGEGGGVLINQAPHSLDLFQWIGGMPKRIIATVDTRAHKIEVEDTANAICQYEGGKMGYIYATTAEAPGVEQFMLSGDKATLIAEGGKLKLGKLSPSITEHLATCREGFASPKCDWEDVPFDASAPWDHIIVTRAFAAHVLRGEKLFATGAEGINELELSNAIYLAGYKNKPIDLPVDAVEIERLIAKLEKERSTGRGGGERKKAASRMRKLMGAG